MILPYLSIKKKHLAVQAGQIWFKRNWRVIDQLGRCNSSCSDWIIEAHMGQKAERFRDETAEALLKIY